MIVNVEEVEDIRDMTYLIGFILRNVEKNPHIYKLELFNLVEEDIKKTFPNLRSDYFDLRYQKSNVNIFKNICDFIFLWLKPTYHNMLQSDGKGNQRSFSLTDIGKEFLQSHSQEFISYLEIQEFLKQKYPKIWLESLSNPQNKKKKEVTANTTEDFEEKQILKQESMGISNLQNLYEEHISAISTKILDKILCLEPEAVERLVGRLLEKMGYGNPEYTPKTGDGGIDIILHQDTLGLKKIFVQVKRYKRNSKISTDEMNSFTGAISKKEGKGIFVTTSDFSKPAIQKAKEHGIALINGSQLCEYVIKYKFGLRIDTTYHTYSLDEIFFDEYDKDINSFEL